jgi:hypothetical protein
LRYCLLRKRSLRPRPMTRTRGQPARSVSTSAVSPALPRTVAALDQSGKPAAERGIELCSGRRQVPPNRRARRSRNRCACGPPSRWSRRNACILRSANLKFTVSVLEPRLC